VQRRGPQEEQTIGNACNTNQEKQYKNLDLTSISDEEAQGFELKN
jgi:hypothetical protein